MYRARGPLSMPPGETRKRARGLCNRGASLDPALFVFELWTLNVNASHSVLSFFRGSQRQSGGGGTQPLDSWKRVSSRMAYVRFAYDHFGPSLVHVCPLKAARRVSSLAFFPTEQQGTLERGWRRGSFTGRSETPLFAGCTEKNHAPRRHRLWRPFLPFTFLY